MILAERVAVTGATGQVGAAILHWLHDAGLNVVAVARNGVIGRVQAGTAGALNLIGWTGDFGDPDNFVGTFFRTEQGQWGFKNPKLFALLNKAVVETNLTKRAAMYRQANNMIMNFLPGVPYAHTKPALAFQKNVVGYIPSPVSLEPFSTVRFVG